MNHKPINTGRRTFDDLVIYDLRPTADEIWAVAGPDGWDPKSIDPDDLPDGFRWCEDHEYGDDIIRTVKITDGSEFRHVTIVRCEHGSLWLWDVDDDPFKRHMQELKDSSDESVQKVLDEGGCDWEVI